MSLSAFTDVTLSEIVVHRSGAATEKRPRFNVRFKSGKKRKII